MEVKAGDIRRTSVFVGDYGSLEGSD